MTYDWEETAVGGGTSAGTLSLERLAREGVGAWWLAGKAEQVEDVGLAALRGLEETGASELAAIETSVVASVVASVPAAVVAAIVVSVVVVVAAWVVGESSWLSSALSNHWAGSGQGGEGKSEELHFDC